MQIARRIDLRRLRLLLKAYRADRHPAVAATVEQLLLGRGWLGDLLDLAEAALPVKRRGRPPKHGRPTPPTPGIRPASGEDPLMPSRYLRVGPFKVQPAGELTVTEASLPKRWQPQVGEKYWTLFVSRVDDKLSVCSDIWERTDMDLESRATFGCHRTKRAAQAHLKALRAWTTQRLGKV